MKTINKDIFMTKVIKLSRKHLKCTLCLICAVVIVLSCIPVSSVTTNAVVETYLEQSLEVYPDRQNNEKYITLNGIMPENASAEAVDVTSEYSEGFPIASDKNDNTQSAELLAAYDISITGKKGDFQPIDDSPILVEIVDPKIASDCVTQLWHIKDDGEYEQVYDFTIEDGKISFYATGFSVYAIVNASEPERVTSADALTSSRAEAGFYLFYHENIYFSSDINRLPRKLKFLIKIDDGTNEI